MWDMYLYVGYLGRISKVYQDFVDTRGSTCRVVYVYGYLETMPGWVHMWDMHVYTIPWDHPGMGEYTRILRIL